MDIIKDLKGKRQPSLLAVAMVHQDTSYTNSITCSLLQETHSEISFRTFQITVCVMQCVTIVFMISLYVVFNRTLSKTWRIVTKPL